MLIVVGGAPRMPVFPVSMVVDLIATKVIVCMAMVDCRCLALMQHERQARQLQRPWACRSPPSEGARRKFRPSMATDQT
jgi:hypothetical protein